MTRGPVLVLGATSGIAREIALELGRRGHSLWLAGRDEGELGRLAADLRIRTGSEARPIHFEALDFDDHDALLDRVLSEAGSLQGVVLAFGYLGDQGRGERDWCEARAIIDLNYTSAVSILLAVARYMEERREGWIVALSSVAGDRGRAGNCLYGSAKAGLTVFLQGLRARMHTCGVHVLTVKPGPVDTGMTFGMPRLPLLTSPARVARDTVRALEKGADVLYSPAAWRWIMAILRLVPERLFKRARL